VKIYAAGSPLGLAGFIMAWHGRSRVESGVRPRTWCEKTGGQRLHRGAFQTKKAQRTACLCETADASVQKERRRGGATVAKLSSNEGAACATEGPGAGCAVIGHPAFPDVSDVLQLSARHSQLHVVDISRPQEKAPTCGTRAQEPLPLHCPLCLCSKFQT
jgi:hypothetical protein